MPRKPKQPKPKPAESAAAPDPPRAPEALPEDFEKLSGLGCSIDQAAASLGLHVGQFVELLKRDAYRAAWERGPASADVKILEALFANATAGNVDAIKFWLTNRHPELWQASNRRKLSAAPADNPPLPSDQPSDPTAAEPGPAAPLDPLDHLAGLVLRLPDASTPLPSAAS
ncbi:MAG: hypothetical protein K2Y37_14815 [Pirellulales bacterium]|nr:hypothetical protein [Pirellulales bacterium]